jgi:hypothetical protein
MEEIDFVGIGSRPPHGIAENFPIRVDGGSNIGI